MKWFASGSVGRRLWPLLAAAMVALAIAVVPPTPPTPSVLAAKGTPAPSGRVIPATRAEPITIEAGHAGQTAFPCESIDAEVRCYTPAQLAKAYGWNQFKDRGKGETVVIVDAYQSPTLLQDVALEDTTFGLPAPHLTIIAPQGLPPFDSLNGDMVGWSGEITLDVESVHAYAPAARIVLDLAKSDQWTDIQAAVKYAVDDNLGGVISMSFGEPECWVASLAAAEHRLFQQAVSEGITLVAASGDTGAGEPSCTSFGLALSVSLPASDPDVTGVGGTNLFLTEGGAWVGETAWMDGYGESGGGFSSLYRTPSYQQTLGLPSRSVPDVAYDAGVNGGILIAWGESGNGPGLFYIDGGTSAGAPAWAAIAAVADQVAGHRLGLLNPELYTLGESQDYGSYFHDITIGNNIIEGMGYDATTGYDVVTGWGTPQLGSLIPALAANLGGTAAGRQS
jgi:subtilase family serine protease